MRILDSLNGQNLSPPPLWVMRQAGRYLPEYRAVRATTSDFISFCLSPEKACEVTLQPIRRYGFDASIIFSDILMVPWALDRNVHFVTGEGPKLTPMDAPGQLSELLFDGLEEKWAPVGEAVRLTRAALPSDTALIGFSGAPWTLMTYMAEGGSSRDFAATRSWLWSDPKGVEKLNDELCEAIIRFLSVQAEAGANVLMLFDSWAGAVPAQFRQQLVLEPAQKIIAGLRQRGIHQPVICFPKHIGEGLIAFANEVDCQAIALDHNTDIKWAADNLPSHITLQGNLDPLALLSAGAEMQRAVDVILEACANRAHIFNLGHGITPPTPPEHVDRLISMVRGK